MTITFAQKTAFHGAAILLTVPALCRKVWLQAETSNVRYRLDGTDPTASVGGIIVAGAASPLEVSCEAGCNVMKVIGVDANAKLNVHYFSQ